MGEDGRHDVVNTNIGIYIAISTYIRIIYHNIFIIYAITYKEPFI